MVNHQAHSRIKLWIVIFLILPFLLEKNQFEIIKSLGTELIECQKGARTHPRERIYKSNMETKMNGNKKGNRTRLFKDWPLNE